MSETGSRGFVRRVVPIQRKSENSPSFLHSPQNSDSSGGGSFDFMDRHFDEELINGGAFFGAPLSPNNDNFLNFPSND